VAVLGEHGYESSIHKSSNYYMPYQFGLPGDDNDRCIMAQKMEFIMMLMIIMTIYSETQVS
jgi:hypothetical protein